MEELRDYEERAEKAEAERDAALAEVANLKQCLYDEKHGITSALKEGVSEEMVDRAWCAASRQVCVPRELIRSALEAVLSHPTR